MVPTFLIAVPVHDVDTLRDTSCISLQSRYRRSQQYSPVECLVVEVNVILRECVRERGECVCE